MTILKIGELAKRTGLTVRTLHHYDQVGLLTPANRSRAGYRLYDEKDLHRLQQIMSMRALGLSLQEIGEMLAAGDPGNHPLSWQLVSGSRGSRADAGAAWRCGA